ncbi:caspase recruitment domain-containing protein 11, partial [Tachysurus ichikawai]
EEGHEGLTQFLLLEVRKLREQLRNSRMCERHLSQRCHVAEDERSRAEKRYQELRKEHSQLERKLFIISLQHVDGTAGRAALIDTSYSTFLYVILSPSNSSKSRLATISFQGLNSGYDFVQDRRLN